MTEKVLGRIFSPQESAEQLGIDVGLMYRLLRANRIRHARAGDRYLISESALREYLEGQRQLCNAGKS